MELRDALYAIGLVGGLVAMWIAVERKLSNHDARLKAGEVLAEKESGRLDRLSDRTNDAHTTLSVLGSEMSGLRREMESGFKGVMRQLTNLSGALNVRRRAEDDEGDA